MPLKRNGKCKKCSFILCYEKRENIFLQQITRKSTRDQVIINTKHGSLPSISHKRNQAKPKPFITFTKEYIILKTILQMKKST